MGGMRKSSFSLEKLYTFVIYFFSNVKSEPKTKKRGRPQKYADKVINRSLVVSDFNRTSPQRNACLGFSTKLSYLLSTGLATSELKI
jgi:hypothetical protein